MQIVPRRSPPHSRWRRPARSGRRLLTLCLLLLGFCSRGQDQTSRGNFFLPQNPVAAAYILGRLSNQELAEAPRSEFVYVALLQRKGLDRKYRLEALEGLAKIRKTDALTELLRAIAELDKKGDDSVAALQDLGFILLQSSPTLLQAHRAELEQPSLRAELACTRQITWATRVQIGTPAASLWEEAQANPPRLEDLLLGLPLVTEASQRDAFYSRVKELLQPNTPSGLLQAAATASVAMRGHESETFIALASLVQGGPETTALAACLARIPAAQWPNDRLASLAQNLVKALQAIPAEQRADSAFTDTIQFAGEVAAKLPPEAEKSLSRILRSLGPTVLTLHAVYEQMRFDKDRMIVESGKMALITLQNDDAMPHNLAILAPGALQEIGQASEKMAPEPDSEGRLYVPPSPKVLLATKLVGPGQKLQLAFNAPAQPADYPFTCTFPGHWLRMSGVLVVVPDLEAYLATNSAPQQPKLTEWKLADFIPDPPNAGTQRNLATGRELFSKLACVQCHRLGSQGYAYGPDLTDVFQRYHKDRAEVLDQILEPSKRIDDRYRNFNFDLKAGDSLAGMVLKQDDQSLTIQTGPSDSLIQVLKRADIQRQRPATSSPMPIGLHNSLSKTEIFDLLAYLESGGNVPAHQHPH